jgi:hypothetical protein
LALHTFIGAKNGGVTSAEIRRVIEEIEDYVNQYGPESKVFSASFQRSEIRVIFTAGYEMIIVYIGTI